MIRVYKELYEKSGLKFGICLRLTFRNIQKHLKLNELRFVPSRSYDGVFNTIVFELMLPYEND